MGPGITQPAVPDDDLIATLSQYTNQLHQQLDADQAPVAHAGTPHSPATGTPAVDHMPPFYTPPGGTQMPGAMPVPGLPPRLPQRTAQPQGPAPGAPGTPAGDANPFGAGQPGDDPARPGGPAGLADDGPGRGRPFGTGQPGDGPGGAYPPGPGGPGSGLDPSGRNPFGAGQPGDDPARPGGPASLADDGPGRGRPFGTGQHGDGPGRANPFTNGQPDGPGGAFTPGPGGPGPANSGRPPLPGRRGGAGPATGGTPPPLPSRGGQPGASPLEGVDVNAFGPGHQGVRGQGPGGPFGRQQGGAPSQRPGASGDLGPGHQGVRGQGPGGPFASRPGGLQPPAPGEPTGQTQAGLTRRVRGAQLPNTQTVSLRRGAGDPSGGVRPGPGPAPLPPRADGGAVGGPFGRTTGPNPVIRPSQGPPPAAAPQSPRAAQPSADQAGDGEGWASERSAKDVYGFLSDFTAGVQRGLDETKNTDKE
jgi:hypothetical protein